MSPSALTQWQLILPTGSGAHQVGLLADERLCRFILLAFEKMLGLAGDCLPFLPGVPV